MYYNINKINGFNKILNIIVGSRSIGKSYALKTYAMRRWLSKHERFIYLRRYSTEIDGNKLQKFFDDVSAQFPGHKWCYKQKKFYCDDDIIGEVICLSKSASFASAVFNGQDYNYGTIIFDEFIIHGNIYRYMRNEVNMLLDMYVTISRGYPTKMYLLGNQRQNENGFDYSNPYFEFYDIMPTTKGIVRGKQWVCEFVDMDSTEHLPQSFLELVEGTDYAQSAIYNASQTNFDHIAEVRGKFLCKLDNTDVGAVNVYFDDDKYYIDSTKNGNGAYSTDEALREHNQRISEAVRGGLLTAYRRGMVFFANSTAKNRFYQIIVKGKRK